MDLSEAAAREAKKREIRRCRYRIRNVLRGLNDLDHGILEAKQRWQLVDSGWISTALRGEKSRLEARIELLNKQIKDARKCQG